MLEELRTQQEYSDFIAARYAGMIGDAASAAAYYRRASEFSPDDSGLLERAALSTLASGDVKEAIRISRASATRVADEAPSAELALIVDDIATGRIKSAEARLKKPVLGALNLDLAAFLSAWLTAVDNADAGVVEVDTLPGRRMIAGEQAALKAVILMHAGRDDEAMVSFQHALRLPLASRDHVAVLAASLAASRDRIADARDVIELVSADGETGAGATRLLADIDAGKKIARPRMDARKGAALAIYVISGTNLVRSSPDLSALRHALALHLDPDLAVARLALAEAYARQVRPDDAIAALRSVPDGSAWAGDARMEEAALLNAQEHVPEALAAADQALMLGKRRELMLRAGDLNRIVSRMDVARKLYDQVISDDAARGLTDWRVLFARATVRSETGDWSGAEADLNAALAIEPDRPELLNYLGYGWINRGERMTEGLALIRRAADARPDQGYIIDSLGWAYFKLGQYDVAVQHLERAAELAPTQSEIIEHLGDAYWRAGRTTEAKFEWTAALRLKPDPLSEAELRTKLDKGLPTSPGASLASRP
jgi:tetratricopeptide (TPR) repeat protein